LICGSATAMPSIRPSPSSSPAASAPAAPLETLEAITSVLSLRIVRVVVPLFSTPYFLFST
jgi:hypothetical protein